MTEREEGFDDAPIITYSNRLQKHMFKLTEKLPYLTTIGQSEKVELLGLIANLPPEGKEALKKIAEQLLSRSLTIEVFEYVGLYEEVSDWIYKSLLQDALHAKPKFHGAGRL